MFVKTVPDSDDWPCVFESWTSYWFCSYSLLQYNRTLTYPWLCHTNICDACRGTLDVCRLCHTCHTRGCRLQMIWQLSCSLTRTKSEVKTIELSVFERLLNQLVLTFHRIEMFRMFGAYVKFNIVASLISDATEATAISSVVAIVLHVKP